MLAIQFLLFSFSSQVYFGDKDLIEHYFHNGCKTHKEATQRELFLAPMIDSRSYKINREKITEYRKRNCRTVKTPSSASQGEYQPVSSPVLVHYIRKSGP